ncbi:hypothetical protein RFI_22555 [Reticulomyxa filosa]|uniref:Uncharacterized protein n=1 Tax=Reticulomyxa filosa TaxID=46433 RepID=X6MLC1_RETFI|nr:hypothetical protein RFI_22555 [Reticulomyxa filosa]|eukprot:ETO14813.1 hypothetical protein RFI_22555 [Reticulomyxa filosa]
MSKECFEESPKVVHTFELHLEQYFSVKERPELLKRRKLNTNDEKRQNKEGERTDHSEDKSTEHSNHHRHHHHHHHHHHHQGHKEKEVETGKNIEKEKEKEKEKNVPKIDKSSYFEKNAEFRIWLLEMKHHYYDDLTTKEAKKWFVKFVHRWNRGKLPGVLFVFRFVTSKYYTGEITLQSLEGERRTRHHWSFRLNEEEKMQLDMTRDRVDSQTNDQTVIQGICHEFHDKLARKVKKMQQKNNDEKIQFESADGLYIFFISSVTQPYFNILHCLYNILL